MRTILRAQRRHRPRHSQRPPPADGAPRLEIINTLSAIQQLTLESLAQLAKTGSERKGADGPKLIWHHVLSTAKMEQQILIHRLQRLRDCESKEIQTELLYLEHFKRIHART